jgi:hypothetical protein
VPSAAEAAATGGSQLQAALDAGLDLISADQAVTFQSYTKITLAPDSSVFWVANGTMETAKGSLHFATDSVQEEDQNIGVNQFIFTSEQEVETFNSIAPTTLLIGSWPFPDGSNLQIVFSSRGKFYEEAGLWHYSGRAVYPAMQTQVISDASQIPVGPIVSNSLPIWLLLTAVGQANVPVYPSFLVPDNLVPPYIVAHVEPGRTVAMQGAPFFQQTSQTLGGTGFYQFTADQLARDEVKLILYGFTNAMAWQYYSTLYNYSLVGPGETPTFGFANSPAIQDEKRTQNEINAIAMKKSLSFQANYYQSAANAAAYRLILSVLPPTVPINGGANAIGLGGVTQNDQTVAAQGVVT